MAQQLQQEMLPTCCYDTENAAVILEHMVDLNGLAENDFDFRQKLKEMGWVKYFNTEGREVFEEAIKEFWKFARMEEDDIVGHVKGFHVRVNPTLISEVIGCKNTGLEHSEKWEKELGGSAHVVIRSSIYKEPGATLAKDMKEDNRVLHKIIINNIIPKSGSVDTVSQDHIFVLWHYHQKTIVNLPALIFKFMKKAMDLSRNTSENRPQQKNIPYARVLSALMENQGVINKLKQLPVKEQGKLLQVTFRKTFGVTNLKRMGLSSRILARRLELEEEELARTEEQDKAKSVASGRRGRGRGIAQATRSNAPRASAEVARKKIADQLFRPADPKKALITVYSDEEEETDKLVLQKQGSSSQASETPQPVPSPAKRKLVKKHQEESQSSKKQKTSESDEGIGQPISLASPTQPITSSTTQTSSEESPAGLSNEVVFEMNIDHPLSSGSTPDSPRHSAIHIHSPGPYIPEPNTFIAFSSTVPPNPLDQSISKRLEEMDIIIQRDAELQSCVIIWQAIEDFYLEWILKDFQRQEEEKKELMNRFLQESDKLLSDLEAEEATGTVTREEISTFFSEREIEFIRRFGSSTEKASGAAKFGRFIKWHSHHDFYQKQQQKHALRMDLGRRILQGHLNTVARSSKFWKQKLAEYRERREKERIEKHERALEKEEEKLALEEKKDKGREQKQYMEAAEAEECIAVPKSEYGKLLEHSEKIARLEQYMETSSKSQEEIKKILNLLVSKFS